MQENIIGYRIKLLRISETAKQKTYRSRRKDVAEKGYYEQI